MPELEWYKGGMWTLYRVGAVLLGLLGLGWVASLVFWLPEKVDGAMCGQGVLSAMGPDGPRSLWFLILMVVVLRMVWGLWEWVKVRNALLLVAGLMVLMSVWFVGKSLLSLNGAGHVDCCSKLVSLGQGRFWSPEHLGRIPSLFLGVGLLILIGLGASWGLLQERRRLALAKWMGGIGLFTAWWLLQLSTFHRCAFCWMGPASSGVGLVFYGILVALAIEVLWVSFLATLIQRDAHVEPICGGKLKRSLLWMGLLSGALGAWVCWWIVH